MPDYLSRMSVCLGGRSWLVGGIVLLGFGSGCATIASPDGGPRDLVAPTLVSTSPEAGARNVRIQTITLEFSEPVQLKDLSKNLIVAPVIPDENHYKILEKRNSVSLIYEQPFEDNTTYSFNFGDAVVDITESNKAKNVRLAFSTGAVLDSGRVQGTVRDLLANKPVENASVLLFPAADTAGVRRGRAYYLARTEKDGSFSLQNLKTGDYRMYALVDKNQSNRYEEGEKIAYLPKLLTVGSQVDSVRLDLVRPDSKRPLITSQQPEIQQFKVSYNEGVRRVRLAPLTASRSADTLGLRLAAQLVEGGRTLQLTNTPSLAEGRYLLTATDSAGNVGRDTVAVRFLEKPAATGKAAARRVPAYSLAGNPSEVFRQGQLRVQFTVPVLITPGQSFATLVQDSTTRQALRLPQNGRLSDDHTELTINLNTKAQNTVTLLLDSTTVRAITGQSLGFRPQRLRVSDEASTGTLSGTIDTKYTNYQVQVVDQNLLPVAVLNNPRKTFLFNNLPPGTYRLRVLIDANNDGVWTGGNPDLQTPPDPVYYFPDALPPVRANWEQENITLKF